MKILDSVDSMVKCAFVGIIMWGVGKYLTANPLTAKNHPFLKESMIHHT